MPKSRTMLTLLLSSAVLAGTARADGDEEKVVCPSPPPPTPKLARSDVYKDVPFKAGEQGTYEIRWAGLKAGFGELEVRTPLNYNGVWQRQFHAHGKTGDWFKAVFVAEDEVQAFSRPWDFGISKFYMEQDEGKIFGRRFQQKKYLEFDHDKCKVKEKVTVPDKADDTAEHDVANGATDALGAAYRLRSYDYKVGKTERFLVYTSEKNWWLEATPIAMEKLTVAAGTYNAMKLQLQTYIGKALQQKGKVFVWIDQGTKDRPLVQIQGEIALGSVWMELVKFQPGS